MKGFSLRMIPVSAVLLLGSTVSAAATWSAPATVTSGGSQVLAPSVAANAAGRTASGWVSNGQLLVSIRDGVANWPAATALPSASVLANTLAVAPDGDVVAVWLEGTSVNAVLKTAAYTGGGWTPVSTLSAGAARNLDLAMDAAGNVTAAWMESSAATNTCAIRAASGTAASGFAAPALLSTDCRNVLDLTVNSRGDAIVAWSNRLVIYGGSPVIVSQRSGAAGAWSLPVIVAGATYRSNSAHVALADNGRAIAVWSDAYGPQFARRTANGTWGVPAAVDPSGSASYTGLTDVVMDATGNATAVFGIFDMTFTAKQLVARRLGSGAVAWARKTPLTSVTSVVEQVRMAANSNGSIVVGWFDSNVKANGVLYGAGVSTYENGVWSRRALAAGNPSFAAGIANGNTTAIWTSGNGATTLQSVTANVP